MDICPLGISSTKQNVPLVRQPGRISFKPPIVVHKRSEIDPAHNERIAEKRTALDRLHQDWLKVSSFIVDEAVEKLRKSGLATEHNLNLHHLAPFKQPMVPAHENPLGEPKVGRVVGQTFISQHVHPANVERHSNPAE
nr:hypothetical protein L204_05274 [Cryptococcus depauperatus CBS 7855]